ncbi:MAG: hypothetical protein E6Q34_08865 [Burkholderiaceae bacterium]|nr:MAG: hypothetical protein E6Q34_08865 [Burkholderiaceae bacterium]
MKIHGEWKISVVRNVLVRTTAGIFNDEGTLAVFEETKLKAPIEQPWAGLTNAERWEMSTASSLQLFPGMREWAFANNCVCLAIVVPSALKKKIHQQQTGDFPPDKVAYFNDLDSACAWLSNKGFPITRAEYPHAEFLEHSRQFVHD